MVGMAINFSQLRHGKRYDMAFGEKIGATFTSTSDVRVGSLDSRKVTGKIIVCMNDETDVSRTIKRLVVEDAKGKWIIIIDRQGDITPFDSGTYPFAQVGQTVGTLLQQFLKQKKKDHPSHLQLLRLSLREALDDSPKISSRLAPGVAIVAAIVPKLRSEYNAPDNKPSSFDIRSGTSMACPHATGVMAFIKSVHPQWSSSIIKSALRTIGKKSTDRYKCTYNCEVWK
ncbi:hypothetical protein OROMI_016447 [Orobanche minor]